MCCTQRSRRAPSALSADSLLLHTVAPFSSFLCCPGQVSQSRDALTVADHPCGPSRPGSESCVEQHSLRDPLRRAAKSYVFANSELPHIVCLAQTWPAFVGNQLLMNLFNHDVFCSRSDLLRYSSSDLLRCPCSDLLRCSCFFALAVAFARVFAISMAHIVRLSQTLPS